MSEVREPVTAPRRVLELGRRGYRKLIYRRVRMLRYEVIAGESRAQDRRHDLDIEILRGPDVRRVLGTSPYLDEADLAKFGRSGSHCIVAMDQGRVVASSWMTTGSVHVPELQRTLEAGPRMHYSSRTYVSPQARGLGLMADLIHAYSAEAPPTDVVWGLVYDWNIASIRSLERLGWSLTGHHETRFVLSRPFAIDRRVTPALGGAKAEAEAEAHLG